jgi:hypothetical protein
MESEKQLFKIFSAVFSDDVEAVNEAMRDAKKAFTYIRQDALYRNNQK